MPKGKRRGRGEGSVYQRKGDKRWVAVLIMEDGKRKPLYGDTQAEAIERRTQALIEMKQGLLATGPKQKVKDYLERWLEEVHKPTIKLNSYIRYRSILDKHILPALGHISLQKLAPHQVQSLYTQKLKEGLKASSVHLIHALLHKALSNAVRWGLVPRNVCDMVTVPRTSKPEIHPLTAKEAQKLLETAKGHQLEAMLTVALTTGMRLGELTGLKWSDIDFEHKNLQIRRTVTYRGGYGFIVSEPKTTRSKRKIVLPIPLIEVLKRHRTNQKEIRLRTGPAWQENDIVFSNTCGNFSDPAKVRKLFLRLLKDADLHRVRFHDLRHSAATILLVMGIHPKVVQELLGHSTIAITMDTYSHVLPSLQEDAIDKLSNLFNSQYEGDTGDTGP
jgi:integrase